MKKTLLLVIITAIGVSMFFNWQELGQSPSGNDLTKIQSSKNYDLTQGRFINQEESNTPRKGSGLSYKLIKEWLTKGTERTPKKSLPQVTPQIELFLAQNEELNVIWFGHSSFLINMDGNIILVDPVFSEAASPIKSMIKRFQPPALSLEELPKVDYILISHDHYDHLDMESIKFFANKPVTFVTPLGVGSHLKKWGVNENNIVERDWWQDFTIGDFSFTATPAHHFSGRKGIDANKTLWASWVLKSAHHSVYFSGDSGYGSHFKEIGQRLGPFDVAFIESGQYNENWQDVHMLPQESVKAFKDLKAEKYFPIHWGMFELALHTWYEPIEQLYHYSQQENFELIAPKLGEIINTSKPTDHALWWHDVIHQKSFLAEETVKPLAEKAETIKVIAEY
ncbi:MBL fold metallo-hydrolase [Litorilituus lipolyticus]|uniref:MBL fold metallo-hydrolase n=1 Tax=Litorilituus lipolyticus TaxID=2491017 RepID=A0A502L583_9GAMM|nr:MBL fold metallo-hydrolase [Litorilituus lipolyticus]TPH18139.1 MBL fold metallo-hydrolase [Litorilituus lipolyticus]